MAKKTFNVFLEEELVRDALGQVNDKLGLSFVVSELLEKLAKGEIEISAMREKTNAS